MPYASWFLAGGLAVAALGVSLQDPPPLRLAGTVVADHTGQPIAGATLLFLREGDEFATREVRADDTGGFDVVGLPPSAYRIEVAAAGHVETHVSVPAGVTGPLALHLVAHGRVTGRLLAPAGGTIVLFENVPAGGTAHQLRARAADDGAFDLSPVLPGVYTLGILHPVVDGRQLRGLVTLPQGGPPRTLRFTGGERVENEQLQLTAMPTFAITGRVVSTDGPFGGPVAARLRQAAPPGISVATRLLRDDLTFRFEDLVPGTYVVEGAENVIGIGPGGERRGEVTVTLAGADAQVEVPMAVWWPPEEKAGAAGATGDAGAIVCALPSEDAPPFIAAIVMDVTPGRDAPLRVVIGRAGEDVTFASLPAGRYYVAARAASDAATRWAPAPGVPPEFVEVTAGGTTTVRFR